MAQTDKGHERTTSTDQRTFWKKLFGREEKNGDEKHVVLPEEDTPKPGGLARRLSQKVIPGLPRAKTFKRQQSELRDRLEPIKPKADERRTLSVDRRLRSPSIVNNSPRLSAPELELLEKTPTIDALVEAPVSTNTQDGEAFLQVSNVPSNVDTTSIASADGFDDMIMDELERRWILNLSMHFRDKSRREKFFVTFAETPTHWRRVTISLDYRNAGPGSLEEELQRTRFQRDKSARIYEAIRESLPDIQFYDTVTNLKLQTENERLHVHVVEDLSEIISYPQVRAISHLKCRRIREDELVFDSHLSGFVYKVRVDGEVFIKKEIPGPDTVDEFLYEINALHQLSGSRSVIQFGGVVLDNKGEVVKGLLISFAEQGALIDVIYDGEGKLPWKRRERWAKQIVQGLAEIHEAGFVQGDFTLSNIVIDDDDNAKIIDINRRGCPVGWEPPEVAALIESNQRISMYIGVKSDLFQLGMVLYALATQHDEPETQRPLSLDCFPTEIPDYYVNLCQRCLNDDPRQRSQAQVCLGLFPPIEETFNLHEHPVPIVVDVRHVDENLFAHELHFGDCNDAHRKLSSVYSPGYRSPGLPGYAETDVTDDSEYFPRRGRSPPAPIKQVLPSNIPLPASVTESDYMDRNRATTELDPGHITDLAFKEQDQEGDSQITPLAIQNGPQQQQDPLPVSLPEPEQTHASAPRDGPQNISEPKATEVRDSEPKIEEIPIPTIYSTDLLGIGGSHGTCIEKLPPDLIFDDDTISRQTYS
jgi:serine/threonine protein kinase